MNPSNVSLICTILQQNAIGWHRRASNFAAQNDKDASSEAKTIAKLLAAQADAVSNHYNEDGKFRYEFRGPHDGRSKAARFVGEFTTKGKL